jgi:hypothetical protein
LEKSRAFKQARSALCAVRASIPFGWLYLALTLGTLFGDAPPFRQNECIMLSSVCVSKDVDYFIRFGGWA